VVGIALTQKIRGDARDGTARRHTREPLFYCREQFAFAYASGC